MSDSDKLNTLRKTMRKLSGQLPKTEASYQRKIGEYESEIEGLQGQVKSLEEEIYHLRRRLEQTPREFEFLRSKLSHSQEQIDQAHQQNERMVQALQNAKEQIAALREEVDKLSAPPPSYRIFAYPNPAGPPPVFPRGGKLKGTAPPHLDLKGLQPGQEPTLNYALNSVEAAGFEGQGE